MCPGRPRRDVLVLLVIALTAVLLPSGGADAHTQLDFTLPAEGTTVGQPVGEISIGFTAPVRLVGTGFEVLDPQGNVLYPFAVTDDDMVFRLQLDPPLAGGAVGVRYEVASLDGHILEGSLTFTAAAEPPPPTTTSTVPLTAPSTAPASTTTVASSHPATTSAATTVTAGALAQSLPSTTHDASGQSSDDDSDRTVLAVVLLAVTLGSAGFVFLRSRRSCRW